MDLNGFLQVRTNDWLAGSVTSLFPAEWEALSYVHRMSTVGRVIRRHYDSPPSVSPLQPAGAGIRGLAGPRVIILTDLNFKIFEPGEDSFCRYDERTRAGSSLSRNVWRHVVLARTVLIVVSDHSSCCGWQRQ